MKKKRNFYKILDINREASPSEIKKAYRKAAKKYHPDLSRRDDETFKQVQEAYETLSDPEKKTVYDHDLLPKKTKATADWDLFSTGDIDRMDRGFRDLDELWSDLVSGFFGFRGREPREEYVEIILSDEEAREGGEIPLEIPVWTSCFRCLGTGNVRGLICGRCRGAGKERSNEEFTIEIPPGATDGMTATIPISGPGRPRAKIIVILKIQRPVKTHD